MPGKYESMVALAAEKALSISTSGKVYMDFLTTAANNFKYTFREQLLIYAQKPNATACAEIKFWNQHGRWVNRGTRGIALLMDGKMPYQLRYVFDISDTNSRRGQEIPLWRMEERYEATVKEVLTNRFGTCNTAQDFPSILIELAELMTEDNFADYLDNLDEVREGSLLEELDADNAKVWLKTALKNSVAFMLLTRCGIDAREYFSPEDFQRVYDFNTVETISVLGAATSDISEMALREIAATVRVMQREENNQIRTFASQAIIGYDKPDRTKERGTNDESDIQNRGRLSIAQLRGAGGSESGEIRDAAAQLPPQPEGGNLHGNAPVWETESALGGDRPSSQRDDGAVDHTDGSDGGRDGAAESDRPDEMGGADDAPV